MSDIECLILPVGVEFGPRRVDDELVLLVRRGTRVHELSEPEHAVWTLAHGTGEAVSRDTPWRRKDVIALAESIGVEDASELVEELLLEGLLIEVVPGTDDAQAFAMEHRVVPLMLGLGNSADEPGMFNIGFLGQPVLQVEFATYDLWQWSAMDDPLWHTCVGAIDAQQRSYLGEESYLEPDKLLTGFLRNFHRLLFVHAACIDTVFRLAHPPARSLREGL